MFVFLVVLPIVYLGHVMQKDNVFVSDGGDDFKKDLDIIKEVQSSAEINDLKDVFNLIRSIKTDKIKARAFLFVAAHQAHNNYLSYEATLSMALEFIGSIKDKYIKKEVMIDYKNLKRDIELININRS